jgi:hypothetical protein
MIVSIIRRCPIVEAADEAEAENGEDKESSRRRWGTMGNAMAMRRRKSQFSK